MRDQTKIVIEEPDESTGAITTPIYQTSSYVLPIGEKYRYTREKNPTVEKLEQKLSEIENAEASTAFSSGMASISTTLLNFLKPGKTLMIQKGIFARTYRFCMDFLTSLNIRVDAVNPDTESIEEALKSRKYDVIFLESITNPLVRVIDLPRIAKVAKEMGSIVVVDSTLSTPINQRVLDQGADVDVESASKFISGHNDVIAGFAAGRKDYITQIDSLRRTLGGSLDPHSAYLVIRGLKTLKVRMDVINRNALKIAEFLDDHPKIKFVYYPGLRDNPDYDIATRILKGFGGIVSFELRGTKNDVLSMFNKLKIIKVSQTFGGVNSVISHPMTMTHRSLNLDEMKEAGITENLIRLSVGIEDVDDLIEDLDSALKSFR
ncbi:MAG: aminotransferase class V-fold PLP-dependent enzyme [Sulfolobus sp.]|nr:aminotransferase class V-fold PLP-dependent enzyme [Sulfolobus sp.]